jgi:hypothetical protein
MEDTLIQSKDLADIYTPKEGYKCLSDIGVLDNQKWWWKLVWKGLFLNNKAHTHDNLQKRNNQGPGHCTLCKVSENFFFHPVISCPFAIQVCKEFYALTSQRLIWDRISIEEGLKHWCEDVVNKGIKVLMFMPLL